MYDIDSEGNLLPHGFKPNLDLKTIEYPNANFERMTLDDMKATPVGSVFTFDVECYPNYFCVNFRCLSTKRVMTFEMSEYHSFRPIDLMWVLWRFCVVGFYSKKYDIFIILAACRDGVSTQELKDLSNDIIQNGLFSFAIEKKYGLKQPEINHIDLIEVCPLSASLKIYGGRLHGKRMQDLPFDPDKNLTRDEMAVVNEYCYNDLEETELLLMNLDQQLTLRSEMSKRYGLDLRSKSDAQIAEAVIGKELAKSLGEYPKKPEFDPTSKYRYTPQDYMTYQNADLNRALNDISNARFPVNNAGEAIWPDGLGTQERGKDGKLRWGIKIRIGETTYKMGMGGLHSQEKQMCHIADDNTVLSDHDVESYYPRIIINQRLYPSHLGQAFLGVYTEIVDKRVSAKRSKDKSTADSLKIVINGTFGKLGSKYSLIYSPGLLLQVTLTGQLTLLKLIDMFEANGIPVVSANTDGVIVKCPKDKLDLRDSIIEEFERITAFVTEETRYLATYSRDINNYIAVKQKQDKDTKEWLNENDGCKFKGCYSNPWADENSIFRFHKNPETTICIEAMAAFITAGTPVAHTIRECHDVTKFVKVRHVKGGAHKDGVYLGRAVRWYYATDATTPLNYVLSGNKVPTSDGGKPLMDLGGGGLPDDLDYEWYEQQTRSMLIDCGCIQPEATADLI